MKLQLFINGGLYVEQELPHYEFNLERVSDNTLVDIRKKKLDRYIAAFKKTFEGKIKETSHWEIIVSVMSKINKQTALRPIEEKSIEEQETVFVRPLSNYSNKGYLSLTGS